MVLTRWDPLFEIRRARHKATRGVYDNPERNGRPAPLDIAREGDNVTVTANLPGVKPEDIVITIEGGVLQIKAETKVEERREDSAYVVRERSTGSFRRSLRLSDHVDTENAEPRYENGVLTITLPVAESQKTRHLKVSSGMALSQGS